MAYYLGVDAGGTKTFCLVGNDRGEVLGFGRGGTGNYEDEGTEAAGREITLAVNAALSGAGIGLSDLSGIGMGIAGADVPDDYVMLEREIFTPLFGEVPRVFRNDSMGGLRGGTKAPYGIVIACGTGCVCAGVNPSGAETRVGGINEHFGDKVSGSSIGEEGLRAVWRYRDGITGPTLLAELFLAQSGCRDLDEFFDAMYCHRITFDHLQPMAKTVFDAALAGDAIACDILISSGEYLGEMVNAAARRLDMTRIPYEVVMAGSVFKGSSPLLRDAMTTIIHRVSPFAVPVMPLFEPVVGCLLLGMELDVTMSEDRYTTLTQSLVQAESRYGVSFKTE